MDIAKSLGQCETPLQREFFSDHNIKILQADLKRGVFCKTNLTIGDQKRDDLLVVMRAMFALYSQNVVPTREIRTEVNRLNDICLREMIPHIYSSGKKNSLDFDDRCRGQTGRESIFFSLEQNFKS
jgi:hypothetical protein